MAGKHYDALVVGSGAAGSFAAQALTEKGFEVLLLEAGRNITPEDFRADFEGPREKGIQLWARIKASLSGQPIQCRVAMYGDQQRHLFVNDREHPYSTPSGQPFLWIRGKQLGGRLHTYGRMLLRWSDADFKAASHDGYGADWPLSYADLAPYYEQVEQALSVRGCVENIPNLPDGSFAGTSRLTAAERTFKERLESRWPDRHAISWRYAPPNTRRVPQPILAARATGRLTIRTDAVVRRVLTDPGSGRATGVECVDRLTKESFAASSDVVVLCASTIESVRLMLNSASVKHPNGLGNSSGTLGRYFMDQLPNMIMGTVPGRQGFELDDSVPPDPFYGVTGGVYIPRYENVGPRSHQAFKRGFAFQGTIGRLYVPDSRPARFAIMGFGEMLPSAANSITLHNARKDAWGMPIPHIACGLHENDLGLLHEQVRSIKEMVDAAGLDTEFNGSALGLQEFGRGAFPDADVFSRAIFRRMFPKGMSMGAAIHESGGARMGTDPATSVLNGYNQCWDAPNVFVTDGSSFPTGGSAGTTLTIMALTLRACEHIARQSAAGKF